jgi:hypothetical protein
MGMVWPYILSMKSTTQERDMNTTTEQTVIDNNQAAITFGKLMNEWDRQMSIKMEKGLTKDEAAAVVGAEMTEWFNVNVFNK